MRFILVRNRPVGEDQQEDYFMDADNIESIFIVLDKDENYKVCMEMKSSHRSVCCFEKEQDARDFIALIVGEKNIEDVESMKFIKRNSDS